MNTARITSELRQGNLVITPTDTVYGILADATIPNIAAKVSAAKHRDRAKPLLLLMSNLDMARAYTKDLNSLEEDLIQNFLPGPLTILLPRNDQISDQITAGSPLVGVRIPDHAELLGIIREVGHPLVSTSANLAGEPPITNPSQISPALLEHIAYVEDAGTISSTPSTLVKAEGDKLKILRSGSLAAQLLDRYPATN